MLYIDLKFKLIMKLGYDACEQQFRRIKAGIKKYRPRMFESDALGTVRRRSQRREQVSERVCTLIGP